MSNEPIQPTQLGGTLMQSTTITLTGNLGQNPSLRSTRERTYTQRQAPTRLLVQLPGRTCEEVLEESADADVTVSSKDYAVLGRR